MIYQGNIRVSSVCLSRHGPLALPIRCKAAIPCGHGKGPAPFPYLDDVIFGAKWAARPSACCKSCSLSKSGSYDPPFQVRRYFGGPTVAVPAFPALGTLGDLATQTYSVPAATVDRILLGIGLVYHRFDRGHIWASTGAAARVRAPEMDHVIASWRLATSRRGAPFELERPSHSHWRLHRRVAVVIGEPHSYQWLPYPGLVPRGPVR